MLLDKTRAHQRGKKVNATLGSHAPIDPSTYSFDCLTKTCDAIGQIDRPTSKQTFKRVHRQTDRRIRRRVLYPRAKDGSCKPDRTAMPTQHVRQDTRCVRGWSRVSSAHLPPCPPLQRNDDGWVPPDHHRVLRNVLIRVYVSAPASFIPHAVRHNAYCRLPSLPPSHPLAACCARAKAS